MDSQAVDVCTDCAYTVNVGFEWDEKSKAGINFRMHGVRMPEAIPVFDDPFAITIKDAESDPGEQRFVKASALRTEMIRIFSPRQVYTTTSNRSAAPMPSVTNAQNTRQDDEEQI